LVNQRDQLQQIGYSQTRPPGRRRHERVDRCQTRPLGVDVTKLSRFVVVEDAVHTPSQAPVHERELAPVQRVEGMRDPEELRLISQIACS